MAPAETLEGQPQRQHWLIVEGIIVRGRALTGCSSCKSTFSAREKHKSSTAIGRKVLHRCSSRRTGQACRST
eukprot:75001-Pelagomonas_calceolata.AAC.5